MMNRSRNRNAGCKTLALGGSVIYERLTSVRDELDWLMRI
jgi:hypothetical protein